MGRSAIVAGTGFPNADGSARNAIIRNYCKPGMKVHLVREPNNKYDSDAIAVYIAIPRLFGLLGSSLAQIGYIKAGAADSLAHKIDSGMKISGTVRSMFAPNDLVHPRVSLQLDY
jgi:HIRAN domain